jgi:chromosome segregation ATPase
MKIKVETLAEVILKELSGDVEYERWFGRILPFLKKIAELEEKNEALNEAFEETKKELESFKGTDSINKELRRENSNLLENIHNLRNKIDFLTCKNEELRETNRKIYNEKEELKSEQRNLLENVDTMNNEIKAQSNEKREYKKLNEELKEKISKLEDTNRKLSGELLNQTEEIHMLEEEIDRMKSANDDLKRLNRQIQEVQK